VQLQAVAIDALLDTTRPIGGGPIFRDPEGGIINLSNYRHRVWRDALQAAGIEYRALDQTRHTFATLALAAGAPIEWVSKQLGHRNIQTIGDDRRSQALDLDRLQQPVELGDIGFEQDVRGR